MNEQDTIKKQEPSKIVIINQCLTNISGVNKVISATENQVSLVVANENMIIDGKDLHVLKLDTECKLLDLEGKISSIKYTKQKEKNFFKRLFS